MIEPYSKPLSCYKNVAKKVEECGGGSVYGWHIHQEEFIYEAEHHTVWQSPDGELIDITPNQKNKSEILFSVDMNSYVGKDVPSVRINITDNVFVEDFITVCELLDSIYATGVRKSNNILDIPTELVPIERNFKKVKDAFDYHLQSGRYRENLCFCKGTTKYTKCHRKDLLNDIALSLVLIEKFK